MNLLTCKYTCHKIDRMKVGTIEFHLKSKDTLVSNQWGNQKDTWCQIVVQLESNLILD